MTSVSAGAGTRGRIAEPGTQVANLYGLDGQSVANPRRVEPDGLRVHGRSFEILGRSAVDLESGAHAALRPLACAACGYRSKLGHVT
jgi:hypothetical protein